MRQICTRKELFTNKKWEKIKYISCSFVKIGSVHKHKYGEFVWK